MVSARTEYKGHRLLKLVEQESDIDMAGRGVQFGLRKWKLVLDHVEDIRKFVEEEENVV